MEELAAILPRLSPNSVVGAFAVYPREGHVGQLEEQGAVLAEVSEAIRTTRPEALCFRVLWTQFVAIVESDESSSIFINAAKEHSNERVEIRGVWCRAEGPRTLEWLDEMIGELSVRANFGSVPWIEGRMIDGRLLPR